MEPLDARRQMIRRQGDQSTRRRPPTTARALRATGRSEPTPNADAAPGVAEVEGRALLETIVAPPDVEAAGEPEAAAVALAGAFEVGPPLALAMLLPGNDEPSGGRMRRTERDVAALVERAVAAYTSQQSVARIPTGR